MARPASTYGPEGAVSKIIHYIDLFYYILIYLAFFNFSACCTVSTVIQQHVRMEVTMPTLEKFGGLSEAAYYLHKSGARMISAKMTRQDSDALTHIAEVCGVSVANLTRRLLKR
jgi:hypothetical protein